MCRVYQNLLPKKEKCQNSDKDTLLQQYHSATKVIFRMFDDAASEFKKKKITVTLDGTVKKVFMVPVLLYMKGDHKSHQENTCCFGHTNDAICISYNCAAAWDADNDKIAIREQINATVLHKKKVEYSNITEQINLLKELIADPDYKDTLKKRRIEDQYIIIEFVEFFFTATQLLPVSIHLRNFLI